MAEKNFFLAVLLAVGAFSMMSVQIMQHKSEIAGLQKQLDLLAGGHSGSILSNGKGSSGHGIDSDSSMNIRVPLRNGEKMNVGDRLRYLEKKVNGALNWVREPKVWYDTQVTCKNPVDLGEGHLSMACTDHLTKGNCLVYDFGVRTQPKYGVFFAKEWGCEVHAFDPSPVTLRWVDTAPELQGLSNYHFHPYGAGGVDGKVMLEEYNWDQVSIVQYPPWLERQPNGDARVRYPPQKRFPLEVKTLPTIMKELGHTHLDVLKIDVEGSEYVFLEQLFDEVGCPNVDQLALEWHHFELDMRYGSSPQINVLLNLFNDCGLLQFSTRVYWFGETDVEPGYKLKFNYNVASLMRAK